MKYLILTIVLVFSAAGQANQLPANCDQGVVNNVSGATFGSIVGGSIAAIATGPVGVGVLFGSILGWHIWEDYKTNNCQGSDVSEIDGAPSQPKS